MRWGRALGNALDNQDDYQSSQHYPLLQKQSLLSIETEKRKKNREEEKEKQ